MRDAGDPVYGFLATVMSLRERFDTDNFVFAFDRGKLKRTEILPTYKDRPPRSPDHEEEHKLAKQTMEQLRRKLLPFFGFKNILSQPGYEADDVIASVVINSLPEGDDAVIVSTDNDLLQLLSTDRVVIYNPNKELVYNEAKFSEEWYGLQPGDWALVKAIAGCRSDNVPGIRGIGETTAAKFVAGQLPWHSSGYEKIKSTKKSVFEERLKLVKLPYEGTQTFTLAEDDNVDWRRVRTYAPKSDD
jgi:DNA polymerase-1